MMERALQERIIGAIVLVIFVVLVVPIFLDGSPDNGKTVSKDVLLPGHDGEARKTIVLDRERSEPIPVAKSEDVAAMPQPPRKPATEQQSARTEQDSAPPHKEAPKPAASITGMWAVQLGSFSNKENAERLAADLRRQGYAAFLSQLKTDSGPLHRVRIGPQKDRESAEAMAARLLKVGHKGQVVPHP